MSKMTKKITILIVVVGVITGIYHLASLIHPFVKNVEEEPLLGGATALNNVITDVADSTPISYNAGTGDNRILIVAIGMAWESDNDISAITYDGDALTELVGGGNNDPWEWGRIEIWYKLNPASGTNNLAISSDDNEVAPLVIAYASDADATGLGTGSGADEDDSDALDVDITPEESGSLLVGGFVFADDGETLSATGGSVLDGQSGATVLVGLATKTSSGTGSHNIALSSTAGDGWASLAMEIKAVAVASSRRIIITN